MDLKQIEKLMAAMNRAGMKRISIKEEGLELELEKEGQGGVVSHSFEPNFQRTHIPASPQPVAQNVKDEGRATTPARYITSPMVGTFYAAPSPNDPAYVKVGDDVDEGSVVCIIEAMKVMNEVKATLRGTIAEILVKNGDPVEFGTKIIRLA